MPQETIIITAAILFAFALFAITLAYADRQTNSRS